MPNPKLDLGFHLRKTQKINNPSKWTLLLKKKSKTKYQLVQGLKQTQSNTRGNPSLKKNPYYIMMNLKKHMKINRFNINNLLPKNQDFEIL